MSFAPFYEYFPEIAERETRSITIFNRDFNLPPDDYGFTEAFCNDKGCDCRRVFFNVIPDKGRRMEAVISYGWEPVSFYAGWMRYCSEKNSGGDQRPNTESTKPTRQLCPCHPFHIQGGFNA